MALLRRMTLTTGEPFDTLAPAADLLARHNRNTEAFEFWRQRVKAVPWDFEAALNLARGDKSFLLFAVSPPTEAPRMTLAPKQRLLSPPKTRPVWGPLNWTCSRRITDHACRSRAAILLPCSSEGGRADQRWKPLFDCSVEPSPSIQHQAPKVQLFRAHVANQFDQALAVFRNQLPDVETPRNTRSRDGNRASLKLGTWRKRSDSFTLFASLDPKQDVKAEIAAVDADLKRIEENERRMPRIHANVDQQEKVRPRV